MNGNVYIHTAKAYCSGEQPQIGAISVTLLVTQCCFHLTSYDVISCSVLSKHYRRPFFASILAKACLNSNLAQPILAIDIHSISGTYQLANTLLVSPDEKSIYRNSRFLNLFVYLLNIVFANWISAQKGL